MSDTLRAALFRLLRPLARILIRYGVSYGEFSEVAKRVFVEVANSDFQLEGRKQTIARVAMLTGIQRKEVSRLRQLEHIEFDALDAEYNRGVRVTGGWRRDRAFQDDSGSARPLPFEGPGSFSELVRRHSGDLPARAVLDELLRVGTVSRDSEGLIHLVHEAGYVPHGEKEAQFNILGSAAKDLIATLDHNFEASARNTRLQLTVAYNNLPAHAVRRFQHISHEDSVELLKKFDVWLAGHDRDSNPNLAGDPDYDESVEGRYRAGIGVYYFEEALEEKPQ